jgi:hypothetical protein
MVNGYGITVIGSPGLWSWFIDLDGCSVNDGVERNLAAAVIAAEDEVSRPTGDPEEVMAADAMQVARMDGRSL